MLAAALLGLAATGSFNFAGGTPNEFVKAFREQTGAPIAVMIDVEGQVASMLAITPVPKISAEWGAEEDAVKTAERRNEVVSDRARLADFGRDRAAFAPAYWPEYIRTGWPNASELQRRLPIDRTIFLKAGDRAEIRTHGDSYLFVGALYDGGLGVRVEGHKIYARAVVAADLTGLAPADALRYVADAIGARLVSVAKDHFRFELDPDQYRERLARSYEHRATEWPHKLEQEGDRLKARILRQVPDDVIVAALSDGPPKPFVPPAPDQDEMRSFIRRLGAMYAEPLGPGESRVSGMQGYADLLKQVDFEGIWWLLVRGGNVNIAMPVLGRPQARISH